jgi:hypothetical protein
MNIEFKLVNDPTAVMAARSEYPRTLIDDRKDAADMLIEACNGGSYTINTKGIEITGRGVKRRYFSGNYEVTEKMLRSLEAQYNVMTNF